MPNSEFERQVGYLVALELHHDNPSLTLSQLVSDVEIELFRREEPLISSAELQGMQCYYRIADHSLEFAAIEVLYEKEVA